MKKKKPCLSCCLPTTFPRLPTILPSADDIAFEMFGREPVFWPVARALQQIASILCCNSYQHYAKCSICLKKLSYSIIEHF